MPLVDELYQENANDISRVKDELGGGAKSEIFDDYITQIEGEIDQILSEDSKQSSTTSK